MSTDVAETTDDDEPMFEPIRKFGIVPEWIIVSGVSARAVQVYALIVASWASRATGNCWPNRRTIAARLSISVDTLDRSISELEGIGAVIVESRYHPSGGQRSNKYWIADTPAANLRPPTSKNAPLPIETLQEPEGGGRESAAGGAAPMRPLEPELDEPESSSSSRARGAPGTFDEEEAKAPVENNSEATARMLKRRDAAVEMVVERRNVVGRSATKDDPDGWVYSARQNITTHVNQIMAAEPNLTPTQVAERIVAGAVGSTANDALQESDSMLGFVKGVGYIPTVDEVMARRATGEPPVDKETGLSKISRLRDELRSAATEDDDEPTEAE